MLQKVFEMIKQSSATTSYIYASRILGLAVREDIENYDANMLNSLAKYYINNKNRAANFLSFWNH